MSGGSARSTGSGALGLLIVVHTIPATKEHWVYTRSAESGV